MTVIRRTPLLCGPASNGYIDRRVVAEMQRQSVRGRGPNGSRGHPTVFAGGTSAGRIPQSMTLAGHLNRIPMYGPGMVAGTRRLGDPREMGLRGFTFDAATNVLDYDNRTTGRADSWVPPSGVKIKGVSITEGSAYPIGAGQPINYTEGIVTFAKGIGPGKLKLTVDAPAPTPTNDVEAQKYTAATNTLKSFNSQLESGQLHPDSAAPAGSDTLVAPTVPANQALYDAYRFQVDRLATSRMLGRWAWEAAHPVAPPAAPSPTTPALPAPAPTTPGTGLQPGVTPVPIGGTAPGYDIYGPGAGGVDQVQPPQAGTTTIAFPGSQPPAAPSSVAPKSQRSAAIGIGVLALLAIGGYALSRRHKK